MSRLSPIKSLAAGRLYSRRSLEDCAVEVIVECPAETGRTKPVLMLDADREKVIRSQEETTLAHEWRRVDGYVAEHRATVRYVFEDVLATPFGFFTRGQSFARLGSLPYRDVLTRRPERRAEGFYCANSITQKYFGHWLRDGLTMSFLQRDHEDLYMPVNPAWRHAKKYVEHLRMEPLPGSHVRFERMSYCDDVGQNSSRGARLRRLQDDVRKLAGDAGVNGVFMRRGDGGARRSLVNENEVIEALRARGFAIVSADDELRDIWDACGSAPVTVSMEGSHACHMFLAGRADALHLSINPADRFNNVLADFATVTDCRVATTVAVPEGDGYRADVDTILKLIDMGHPKEPIPGA